MTKSVATARSKQAKAKLLVSARKSGAIEMHAKRKRLIAEIQEAVPEADDEMLEAIAAMLNGEASDDEPEIPRGVSMMIGESPKGMPYYIQAACLAAVKAVGVEEMETRLCKRREIVTTLFMLGLGKPGATPPPQRKMKRSAFIKWYTEEHDKIGAPLHRIPLSPALNLSMHVGPYLFAQSDADSDFYDQIHERATGRTCDILLMQTVKHRIPKVGVPHEWRIDKNWHVRDAVLLRVATGSTESIIDMFPKEPTKNQDMAINEYDD